MENDSGMPAVVADHGLDQDSNAQTVPLGLNTPTGSGTSRCSTPRTAPTPPVPITSPTPSKRPRHSSSIQGSLMTPPNSVDVYDQTPLTPYSLQAYLQDQIDKKDREIDKLRSEKAEQKKEIDLLRTEYHDLEKKNQELMIKNQVLDHDLAKKNQDLEKTQKNFQEQHEKYKRIKNEFQTRNALVDREVLPSLQASVESQKLMIQRLQTFQRSPWNVGGLGAASQSTSLNSNITQGFWGPSGGPNHPSSH